MKVTTVGLDLAKSVFTLQGWMNTVERCCARRCAAPSFWNC
jgi:hypothetical protein